MARKPDVQYIRYYTDGSAARQLEPKLPRKRNPLPQVQPQQRKVIPIQPVAIGGIVLAALLLIMMTVGCLQLRAAQAQKAAMEKYVQDLTYHNGRLNYTYQKDLDLDEIEKAALALGMIPEEEARHITISVPMEEAAPQSMEQLSFWDRFTVFLQGLFA